MSFNADLRAVCDRLDKQRPYSFQLSSGATFTSQNRPVRFLQDCLRSADSPLQGHWE